MELPLETSTAHPVTYVRMFPETRSNRTPKPRHSCFRLCSLLGDFSLVLSIFVRKMDQSPKHEHERWRNMDQNKQILTAKDWSGMAAMQTPVKPAHAVGGTRRNCDCYKQDQRFRTRLSLEASNSSIRHTNAQNQMRRK